MRLAIIGAQHPHVLSLTRAAVERPDFDLVAVAEPQDELRERVAESFSVRSLADHRELLDGGLIDAAAVAPVNNQKGGIIADCLRAGVHVVADKPLVTTLDDLALVSEAHARSSAALYCALTLRFSAPFALAKRMVDGGEIGQVAASMAQRPHKLGMQPRPAWMFDSVQYGGILVDLSIHDIDAVRWLHGCEPVSVAASQGLARFTEHSDFTDHCETHLRMADGSAGLVRASWLTPDAAPFHGDCRMFVEGTQGYLEVRTSAEEALIVNAGGEVRTITDFGREPEIEQPSSMQAMVEDFVAVTEGRTDTVLTTRDVIESHRWALLARQAADAGELVRYP